MSLFQNAFFLNSISGRYRTITKQTIQKRLQNYINSSNNNLNTLEQFKNIWRGGEHLDLNGAECLMSVYFEPMQACRSSTSNPPPINRNTSRRSQKFQNLIGQYNTRYQTQVGSRDRSSRYIHPFIIPQVPGQLANSTIQASTIVPINFPDLEVDEEYWLEKQSGIFQICIVAMHATEISS